MVEIAARQQLLVPPQKRACIDKARSTAWKTWQNGHGVLAARLSKVRAAMIPQSCGRNRIRQEPINVG